MDPNPNRIIFQTIAIIFFVLAGYLGCLVWFEKYTALTKSQNALALLQKKYEQVDQKLAQTLAELKKRPPPIIPPKASKNPLAITRPQKDDSLVEEITTVVIKAPKLSPDLQLWLILITENGAVWPYANCNETKDCRSKIPNPLKYGAAELNVKIGPPHLLPSPQKFTLQLTAVDSKESERLAALALYNVQHGFEGDGSFIEIKSSYEVKRTVVRTK